MELLNIKVDVLIPGSNEPITKLIPAFRGTLHLLTLIDFIRKRIARRRIEASLGRHLGSAPAPS
jgi:hypothetical protein